MKFSQTTIAAAIFAIRDFIDKERPYVLFSAEEVLGFAFALINGGGYTCQKMFLRHDLGGLVQATISLEIPETGRTPFLTYRWGKMLDTHYTTKLNEAVFKATDGMLGKLPQSMK